MCSLAAENWWRLIVWLAIGMVIYFGYGRRHSHLAKTLLREPAQRVSTSTIQAD